MPIHPLTSTAAVLNLLLIFSELYVVVRPSVCRLSVTFVHPTQAIEIFRNVSTPFNTLVIWRHPGKILQRSSKGNPSVGRVKHEGWPNMAILDLSNAISRKRCKIGGKLLLITNRKSHISFLLVPKSVTLNDLERLRPNCTVISSNSDGLRKSGLRYTTTFCSRNVRQRM